MAESKLGSNEVACWSFTLSQFAAEELATVLSPDEHQRAARFVFDRDRNEYIVCRGVLRHLLAQYGAGFASDLRFEYSITGKPRLPPNRNLAGLEFNVSHSHGSALIGITRGRAVGVDVEQVRLLPNLAGLVRTCFAVDEQAEFWSLSEPSRTMAFFTGWTRKESLIKATGEGLSRALDSFAVTLTPDMPARLLRLDSQLGTPSGWTIVDLRLDVSTASAVAVPYTDAIVHVHDLFPKLLGL